jgi:hypothetical protein
MSMQREIKLGLRDENGQCHHRFCEALLHALCTRGVIQVEGVLRAISVGKKVDTLHGILCRHPVEFNEEAKRIRAKFRLLGEDI